MKEFFIAFINQPRDTSDPFDTFDEALSAAKELAVTYRTTALVLKAVGGIQATPQYSELVITKPEE